MRHYSGSFGHAHELSGLPATAPASPARAWTQHDGPLSSDTRDLVAPKASKEPSKATSPSYPASNGDEAADLIPPPPASPIADSSTKSPASPTTATSKHYQEAKQDHNSMEQQHSQPLRGNRPILQPLQPLFFTSNNQANMDWDENTSSEDDDGDYSDGPDLSTHLPPQLSNIKPQLGLHHPPSLPFAARHSVTLRKSVAPPPLQTQGSRFNAKPMPIRSPTQQPASGTKRDAPPPPYTAHTTTTTSKRHSASRKGETTWLCVSTLLYFITLRNLPILHSLIHVPHPVIGSLIPLLTTVLVSFLLARFTTNRRAFLRKTFVRISRSRDSTVLMGAMVIAIVGSYVIPGMFTILHALSCRVPVLGAVAVFGILLSSCAVLACGALVIVGLHTWDITVVVHGVVVSVVKTLVGFAFPGKGSSAGSHRADSVNLDESERSERTESVASRPESVASSMGGRRGSLQSFGGGSVAGLSSGGGGGGGGRRRESLNVPFEDMDRGGGRGFFRQRETGGGYGLGSGQYGVGLGNVAPPSLHHLPRHHHQYHHLMNLPSPPLHPASPPLVSLTSPTTLPLHVTDPYRLNSINETSGTTSILDRSVPAFTDLAYNPMSSPRSPSLYSYVPAPSMGNRHIPVGPGSAATAYAYSTGSPTRGMMVGAEGHVPPSVADNYVAFRGSGGSAGGRLMSFSPSRVGSIVEAGGGDMVGDDRVGKDAIEIGKEVEIDANEVIERSAVEDDSVGEKLFSGENVPVLAPAAEEHFKE
ncbi:hypothetical protein HDU97_001048 [Phlyctochytrium planicorne]|nr:hypothetical protein HDU97_001048 [Phlyctochytrium planicorne]